MSDELVFFEPEPEENRPPAKSAMPPWKILIVDDDEGVHEATKFALNGLEFLKRPLSFQHAYSAAEAYTTLETNRDIAVILLDVVMETDLAGLQLVKQIRDELRLSDVRIILRTGQPGYAPEMEVIQQYDINDYKNKSDLTRTRLYTSITSALRSYSQISALHTSKQGLEVIVRATSELMSLRGIQDLANGIITQLAAVLGIPAEGMICFRSKPEQEEEECGTQDFIIVAASGSFSTSVDTCLSEVSDGEMQTLLNETIEQRKTMVNDHATALYFPNGFGDDMLLYIDIQRPLQETERQLLEVFCTNIAVCLDNVTILNRLHNYAYYDSLLDIPNRISFTQHIHQVMQDESAEQTVILIDIDHFSGINSTLGTESGDELLRLISNRLSSNLQGEAFICRLSGDTFGLIGPSSQITPERIRQIFTKPFQLFGNEQMISITQGYYRIKDANINASNVIKRANIALKQAKDIVRGDCVEYTTEIENQTHNRMLLLQGLRKASNENELFLAYQPQIDLRTGKISGLEALMRWRTKNGSLIPPDQFIPVAESSGLIVQLGEWVLTKALEDLAQLEKRFQLGLTLGINISLVQFRHPNFLSMIQSHLEQSDLTPGQIEFEVTESVAMIEIEKVKAILTQIRELGPRIALDDFGTGFSCLSYLEKLHYDRLKIDKSFIDQMTDPDVRTNIPEMIINLGKELNLSVIAEGVETEEQVSQLQALGCYEAQGYHFGRPMALTDLEQWLKKHLNQHRE